MRGTRFTDIVTGVGGDRTGTSTALEVPRGCPFVLLVINLHLTYLALTLQNPLCLH
jgi:hypothetical protein